MAYMVLKRIDPMSYAKVYAVITALVVFVFCLIYAFFIIAFAGMMGEEAGAIGAGIAIVVVIVAPIAYGILVFLLGLLMAWLYNVVAARIGGIELEFEEYE